MSVERMLPMQLNHRIFRGIDTKSIEPLIDALQVKCREVPRGSALLAQGDENKYICILLKGKAHAVRYTSEGRQVDYALLNEGALYGYALAFTRAHQSPVTVFTDSDCQILYFSYEQLLSTNLPAAKLLLQNLIEELSEGYFSLQQRLHYLTCDTLREKITSYLHDQCNGSKDRFMIPLDRNALASYLYCDRSALCRELSRMKTEGIIWYKKNEFQFLKKSELH